MILFCVAELIVKITLKREEKDFKEKLTIYKKVITVFDIIWWKAVMNAEIKILNKNEI